jgi:hypothetical protein
MRSVPGLLSPLVAFGLSLGACVANDAPPPEDDPAADAYGWPVDGSCPAPAGKLTVYAIAPPIPLDWSSPNKLLRSVLDSRSAGDALLASGAAVMKRSIGHVNLELDCGEDSIALTGQTGGGKEWVAATDGAGLLLRDTPGAMDDMPTGDPETTPADIAARKASGKVSIISFVVSKPMCRRLKHFMSEYIRWDAYLHYNGSFRARRMEGAGCAIFGAGMIDVGGLLRRSLMTPAWSRNTMIGSARIADFLGDGSYQYGGNLVARGDDGTPYLWPEGQDVPVSNTTPVYMGSKILDAWSGPEDTEWPIAGLTGRMRTQLPFSIYDPELMAVWAEAVWQEASASATGTATSLGVTWKPRTVGLAHEVVTDASCVKPQTLGFRDDHPDLYEDSDNR